jgi:hypothetical protein
MDYSEKVSSIVISQFPLPRKEIIDEAVVVITGFEQSPNFNYISSNILLPTFLTLSITSAVSSTYDSSPPIFILGFLFFTLYYLLYLLN